MARRRSKRFWLLSAAAAVLIALAIWAVYAVVSHVDEDLERLGPYAETQAYEALIARVQSHPPDATGFRFVVLGDTRSNMPVARDILERAAAEDPAFVLNTGDLLRPATVDNYLTYHLPLIEAIAPLPHIPVPGNHEDGPNRDFAGFKAIYGADRFSFDYGDCRFVGFNNGDRLRVSPGDLRFLREELSKPGVRHKFVIMHVPPNDVSAAAGRGFKWNVGAFHRLMREMDVTTVFMGHIHGYAAETREGVRYVITGGAGAPLADTLGEEGRVRNYVVMHVTSEGVRGEAVRQVGSEWVRDAIQ